MLTVLQVAQRGVDIYDPASRWDLLLSGSRYADSTVGVTIDEANKALVVAFRGTDTREDVLKDLEAALPQPAGELGAIALGFFEGTKAVFQRIEAMIPGYRLICTGHSLGAAQASDFAAWAGYHGLPAHACVLMGSPRPGGASLDFWLDKLPAWYSFRNGIDPVCDLPPWALHDRPQIALNEPGPPNEGAVGWHHSALYLQGIAKLQLPPLVEP